MEQNTDDGELLVVAMTRPAMLMGITLNGLVFSIYIPFMIAAITRTGWFFLLIPLCLLYSYKCCLDDVHYFDKLMAAFRLPGCPNESHWGCLSYVPG